MFPRYNAAPSLKPLLPTLNWIIALLGIAFVLSLAWCGHSGAGIGLSGDFQVGADAVHLVTASIWVGGLLPLLIFIKPSVPLGATERYQLVRQFLCWRPGQWPC